MNLKSILEAGDLKDKRVLVRVDWNVPIENGRVRDEYRIKMSMPTIEYLKNAGAKVILATHLSPDASSVEPLRKYVPEGVELLNNLRSSPGEKNNDQSFAKELASRADIYINEAFPESHHKFASIVTLPKLLPSYAGLRFLKEIQELSRSFNPPHPFLLVLGGAKSDTKLPLLEKFVNIADHIFIGGAMAKTASLMLISSNPKIIFPIGDISAIDANTETLSLLEEKIKSSEFILWNGPLGKYENGFKEGTFALARMLSNSGKQVIVGGGDTLAAIEELNILDKFSFVSTGGGAMLEFLAEGTLPGIEALNQ